MNIKKWFSKEKSERYEHDDYKMNSSRRTMIIIAAISLVLAFIVWTVAVYVDAETRTFSSVAIEVRGGERLSEGYHILIDNENVTFTVRGRKNLVNSLTYASVVPYIDVSGLKPTDERAELRVQFQYDGKLVISDVSVEKVTVQIISETEP